MRHLAVTKPGNLWKDELHPVAPLPTRAQLGNHLAIDRSLGIDETLKIEGIGHDVRTRVSSFTLRFLNKPGCPATLPPREDVGGGEI